MGNVNSTIPPEGQGHPELYYRGVKAVGEARFTVAELFFIQALQEHPARKFWHTLMAAVLHSNDEGGALGSEIDARAEEASHEVVEDGPKGATELKASLPSDDVSKAFHSAESYAGEDASPPKSKELAVDDAAGSQCGGDESGVSSERPFKSKVTDIMLPLNGDLVHILDFCRLLADTAMTYLNLLSTTRHREKVMGLAARYCLLTISHTQVLLHCLTLWKEERFGDGGGFLDYEGKRQQSGAVDATMAGEEQEVVKSKHRLHRHRSKTPAAHFVLALAEASCRYYFLAFLTNYADLILQEYQSTMDRRKQAHVYANAVDHIEVVFATAWDISREYPNEYISGLIQAYIPKPNAVSARDGQSSGCTRSWGSTMKSLSQGDGQYRHLYVCGAPWIATQSAFVPLLLAHRVRLCVQESGAHRSVAMLLTPAQRVAHGYRKWMNALVILSASGTSAYVLKRSLPDFNFGKGTTALSTEVILRGAGGGGVVGCGFGIDTGAGANTLAAAQAMPLAEQKLLVKKCTDVVQRCKYQVNADLDLDDDRTITALCEEEVVRLVLPALFLSMKMNVAAGQKDVALERGKTVCDVLLGLYGPDTAEFYLKRYMVQCVLAS